MQHQQQSDHSNDKSHHNVEQHHSALSPNDNAIKIPRKRGKVATTLMTRSTISKPACSAADTKRRHLLYNEAVQRARDYMLTNYGQKYAEQHEEEEIVMV
jgi:tRNA(Ile)-lysidine synthase TilS/MesJ